MLNLRQVAAADIALHGPWFVITEFAVGFLLPGALGAASLFRGRSFWQLTLGIYLVLLSVNYLALLLYSVIIRTRERATLEVGDLIGDRPALIRLSKQSLLLLVPVHRHRRKGEH